MRPAGASDTGTHSVHSGSGCCLSSCAQNADHVTKPSGDEPGARVEKRQAVSYNPFRQFDDLRRRSIALLAWSPSVSQSPPISPLAPASFPDLPPITGVRLAAHAAALSYRGRFDVMLAGLAPGSRVAGVFTRSRCASAPVNWCREHIGRGTARAVLCNAGNANAFTGAAGEATVAGSVEAVGRALDELPEDVYLASTGVIGEPLSPNAMQAAVEQAAQALAPPSPDRWRAAADAIRTTDTFPKGAGGRGAA